MGSQGRPDPHAHHCGSPCSRDGCRRLIPAFVVEDMQPALVGIDSESGLTSGAGDSTWLARIGSGNHDTCVIGTLA